MMDLSRLYWKAKGFEVQSSKPKYQMTGFLLEFIPYFVTGQE